MKNVCYERMRPHEVRAERKQRPLAYLPIGNIEWHGEQNPFGVDTLTAHGLAVRAAQKSGGIVMPPLWWGEPREFMNVEANPDTRDEVLAAMQIPPENFKPGFMGKPHEDQAHAYNSLLFHCYHHLASIGFKAILVVCGHYPLRFFAEFTAEVFMRESPVRVAVVVPPHLISDLREQIGGRIGDHGGKFETSVMMAMNPELVDLARLSPDPKNWPAGVGGEDPRESNADFGQRAMDAMTRRLGEAAAALMRKAGIAT